MQAGDPVKDLLPFRHVDVFSERPYAGNGLIVVFGGVENAADRLLAVAQELRQFETIFVEEPHDDVGVEARIFTVEEELPFAGHPVIGAAAALHERLASDEGERQWTFQNRRQIRGRDEQLPWRLLRRDDEPRQALGAANGRRGTTVGVRDGARTSRT